MIVLILILLLSLLLFPYAWGRIHCARMIRRLKQVGRKNGYRFRRLGGRVWHLKNFSSRYDFCLSNQSVVYPIQLLVSYHRGRTLVVREDGRIREQGKQRVPIEGRRNASTSTRGIGGWRAVPKTVMPSVKTQGKRVVPVLLNYPAYEKIIRLRKEGAAVLNNGDWLFEKRVYLPSAFEKLLSQQNIS